MKNRFYLLTLAIFVLIMPYNVKAYLDPGTASFVTQIIIAGFTTALLSIKFFWKKIKKIFSYFYDRGNEEQEKK